MFPKNQEKEDSSNLVDENSEQLQDKTHGDSRKQPSTIIGIIFCSNHDTNLFWIENIPSQPKLLAWCSYKNNKISIA